MNEPTSPQDGDDPTSPTPADHQRLADNPLAWITEIDGLLIDLRHAPRKIQEAAFEQGLIPFVPDNPEEAGDERNGDGTA